MEIPGSDKTWPGGRKRKPARPAFPYRKGLGGDCRDRLRGLLGLVILDGGLEGFFRENGTVNLDRGQAAEGVDDFLVGEVLGFLEGAALDELGGHAGGGDGAAAAEGLEAGVLDLAVADLEGDLHDVAAGGRTDFADAVGFLHIAHVAGIEEVVHHGVVIKGVFFGLMCISPKQ